MATSAIDRKLTWTAAAFLVLIPIAHLVIARFYANNWGLDQWQFLPWWFGLLWLVIISMVGGLIFVDPKLWPDNRLHDSRLIVWAAIAAAILVVFKFDSFVFAAGNIRVAEMAQRDYFLPRWFEYGSLITVHLLYQLLSLFVSKADAAGVWAWRSLSYLSAAASLIGVVKLSGLFSEKSVRRVALFIMLFFGPQVLPLFGFVGYSAVVVAITVWFAYFALRGLQDGSLLSLASMWVVLLAGLFFHASFVYLIPPALFVTTRVLVRGQKGSVAGWGLATVAYVVLLAMLYVEAAAHLEWLVEILTVKGKNPFSDYGLFSSRHLGDMLQLLIGYAPQVLLILAIWLITRVRSRDHGAVQFAGILALCGFTVVFIFDPSNGIPSDVPIMTAYLFGISLLLALVCERVRGAESDGASTRSAAVVVMLVVGALIGYAPVYLNISSADPYLTRYYDQHKGYYATACFAFRDAYFYNSNLDKANWWEQAVKSRSDYYINITGVSNLIESGDNDEALRTLAWVRSQFPYRVEPQQLTATAELNLHRFAPAKEHIDTCFMLDPYGRDHFRNLYIYYRDQQKYPEAVQTLNRALAIYRGDLDFTVDLMISHYRMADYITADSLCTVVLDKDPKQPYPYLIRGLLAELGQSREMALTNYKKFMELAPEQPEADFVKKRLDSLEANPGH